MKNNTPKIGLVLFSLAGGGAERNAINLGYYFKKKGKILDLILIKSINDYENTINWKIKIIPIISILNFSKRIPRLLYPFRAIESFIKLLVVARKNKYDILIGGTEYFPYYYAIIVAKLLHIKSIVVIGNNLREDLNFYPHLFKYIHKMLLHFFLAKSDIVLCVSRGISRLTMEDFNLPAHQIRTVYNGLDIKEIKRLKLFGTADKKFIKTDYIVSLGRLVYKKGHRHLINSFYEVKKTFPKLKLLIVGRGFRLQNLREQIRTLKLESDVYFLGFEKNPFKYISRAKIFIFPSLFEGFGNVIIEAMASGVPVISTDCLYGPREIISGKKVSYPLKPLEKIEYCKYGVLTPTIERSDSAQIVLAKEKLLTKAIIHLLSDKNLYNQYRKISAKRAQQFTIEKMGNEYLEVIKNIVST